MQRTRSWVLAGFVITGCAAPVGYDAGELGNGSAAREADPQTGWAVRPSGQDADRFASVADEDRDVRYETRIGYEQGVRDEVPPADDAYQPGCVPGAFELEWPADVPEDARVPVGVERGGELVFEAEGELHDLQDEDWYVLSEEAVHYLGRAIEAELVDVPHAKYELAIQRSCEGKMTQPSRGEGLARFVDSCATGGPLHIRVAADSLGANKCVPYRLVVRSER